MSPRAKWIALSSACTLLAATAFSQSPPFPSGLSFSSSTRFVRTDYIVDEGPQRKVVWVSEGANGEDQGLRVPANVGNTPPTSVQHRRSFTPAAGVTARAKMRVRLDHVNDGEGKFGFYSLRPNPFVGGSGSEPDYGAYFYQKEGWAELEQPHCVKAEIWARVNNNTSGEPDTEYLLFTYEEKSGEACNPEGDVYDLIVEVNGTSNVTFYWKRSSGTTFLSHPFTTDLPTGEMHFSASRRCIDASNGYMQLRMFEWEVIED